MWFANAIMNGVHKHIHAHNCPHTRFRDIIRLQSECGFHVQALVFANSCQCQKEANGRVIGDLRMHAPVVSNMSAHHVTLILHQL